jgi:asparagine N-glycosylation enzyme membrane subunit Stt3
LCAVLAIALTLRDVGNQAEIGGSVGYNNQPQLINPDGYYYLNIARELVRGEYSSRDNNRIYPQGEKRSTLPPLLSYLIASIADATQQTVDWVGVHLPVFACLLLAVPLFLFGRELGGSFFAVIAIFYGLVAPFYINRTFLGLLDTDCLNLFFPLMAAYCFYRFSRLPHGIGRYLWLTAGLIDTAIFLWWWDMATVAALLLCLLPFITSLLLLFARAKKKIRALLAVSAVAVIATLMVLFPDQIDTLINDLLGKIAYITGSSTSQNLYPQSAAFNLEQQAPSLKAIAANLTRPSLLTVVGTCGSAADGAAPP